MHSGELAHVILKQDRLLIRALSASVVTTDGLRKGEAFAGSWFCGFQGTLVHEHQKERRDWEVASG